MNLNDSACAIVVDRCMFRFRRNILRFCCADNDDDDDNNDQDDNP